MGNVLPHGFETTNYLIFSNQIVEDYSCVTLRISLRSFPSRNETISNTRVGQQDFSSRCISDTSFEEFDECESLLKAMQRYLILLYVKDSRIQNYRAQLITLFNNDTGAFV